MNATVIDAICDERRKQDEKWGDQRELPPRTWITILGEEFGEVCRAELESDSGGYRQELIQVAAVAIAAVESFDSRQKG